MIFISNYGKYRLILRPQRFQVYNFGNRMIIPGVKCLFVDYKFETEDKEIIKAMLAHKDFGIDFRIQKDDTPNETGLMEKKIEEPSINQLLTSCPKCAFKARNESGLRLHIAAKHANGGDAVAE